MERNASQYNSNSIASRIIQLALGLLVSTSDLPPYPLHCEYLSYNCSFDSDCRWASIGKSSNHWKIARGEPDTLLWLAATGTTQIPKQPFALIEQQGDPVDKLMTDEIVCHRGFADFSFTYWAIGRADLEICLTDIKGDRINCTGMLGSSAIPGKVNLSIPNVQEPFRIMISSNNLPGMLIIDDIRSSIKQCQKDSSNSSGTEESDLLTLATLPYNVISWTRNVNNSTLLPSFTTEPITSPSNTRTTMNSRLLEMLTIDISEPVLPHISNIEKSITTTDIPFELMIYGNRTRPMFDRRKGRIISDSTKLLCDFNDEFACQWGAEVGRWAIIEEGTDKQLIECIDESMNTGKENQLAVFDLTRTKKNWLFIQLNLIPHWDRGVKNRFLVIDEIAYIGECSQVDFTPDMELLELQASPIHATMTTLSESDTLEFLATEKETEMIQTSKPKAIRTIPKVTTLPSTHIIRESATESYQSEVPHEIRTTTRTPTILKEHESLRPVIRWMMPDPETMEELMQRDYCDALNCNFNEDSCNYLNHGLTKKPWTLRKRGYGYPLTGSNDIRPSTPNGKFVSTILDPGDIAILESPKIVASSYLNILLFEYYRPSKMTTIRLCLVSRAARLPATVAEFVRCPPILRPNTSRNLFRWNTIHIQLPPGTTQFFLVAHNSERANTRAAIAVDNIRVAICDFNTSAPDDLHKIEDDEQYAILGTKPL
ncbi:hypothetical protein DICVIV_10172 [Dictyocaulus viviparus]|uniref:MAM domain-containing protein n=1 Tax=Dictyocaulus viviparus TaxID=29172 RepID=A0A0D8XGL5_DICVI|nr:hypothetical protein DICVIV_10172 [Dictyocaulus viviparus]